MNRFKSLIIGVGVALFNVSTAFIQVFRPERCTGACGSCGLSCAQSVIGLVGIGSIVILWGKFKKKIVKLRKNIISG